MHKRLVFFSNIDINDPNRGCQALVIGSFSFISKMLNTDNFEVILPEFYIRRKRDDQVSRVAVGDTQIIMTRRFFWLPSIILNSLFLRCFRKPFPLGLFARNVKQAECVFSIAGGDAFSDIYGTRIFRFVNWVPYFAAFSKLPLVLLPQTIGPFIHKKNYKKAVTILKGAKQVFVRDLSYADTLKKLNVEFSLSNDVSYFMPPKKVNINIPEGAVGINISGLMYFDVFNDLSGRFYSYKELLARLMDRLQLLGVSIVLIPHTYSVGCENEFDDDLLAIRKFVSSLKKSDGVLVVDSDYSASELKYVISQCDFFIGSRMHANFAALFSKVPVFGLAYSYKYEGAFLRYGLKDSFALITDLQISDVDDIVSKIMSCYENRRVDQALLEKMFD